MNTPTIDGIPVPQARLHAELTNATCYRRAEVTAYIIADHREEVFWDCGATHGFGCDVVTVEIALRPGFGPTDHLFDRLAERVIDALEGCMFASESALRRAASAITRPECAYTVTVTASIPSEIPEALRASADKIIAKIYAREDAARAKKKLKDRSRINLAPVQIAAREWVIGPTVKRDGLYAYAFHMQVGNNYMGLQFPPPVFPSHSEAQAAIAEYDAAIGWSVTLATATRRQNEYLHTF